MKITEDINTIETKFEFDYIVLIKGDLRFGECGVEETSTFKHLQIYDNRLLTIFPRGLDINSWTQCIKPPVYRQFYGIWDKERKNVYLDTLISGPCVVASSDWKPVFVIPSESSLSCKFSCEYREEKRDENLENQLRQEHQAEKEITYVEVSGPVSTMTLRLNPHPKKHHMVFRGVSRYEDGVRIDVVSGYSGEGDYYYAIIYVDQKTKERTCLTATNDCYQYVYQDGFIIATSGGWDFIYDIIDIKNGIKSSQIPMVEYFGYLCPDTNQGIRLIPNLGRTVTVFRRVITNES